MMKKKFILAGILLIGVLLVYQLFLGERVSYQDVSISPDGMYKCMVTETHTIGQSEGLVEVFQRAASGGDHWNSIRTGDVYNDSACRSNYTINWGYDASIQTNKVTVFGDFGSPPYAGTIVFDMSIGAGNSAPATNLATMLTNTGTDSR